MQGRTLRSGKAFSPWALGHPTLDLNLVNLIADHTTSDSGDELDELDVPAVLPEDYALLTAAHSDGVDDLSALQAQLPGQLLSSPPSPVLTALPLVDDVDDGGEDQEGSPAPGRLGEETPAQDVISTDPAAAGRRAKRVRERRRKKEKLNGAAGQEALRRTRFINKSLCVAHSDFLVSRAIHSKEGYVGIPDQGHEWTGGSPTSQRYTYLREVGGYQEVDTTLNPHVDYPFIDREGRVWAVALSEPLGWEKRRLGIRRARERLVQRVAGLKAPENRRGDFRSYQCGFSFGNGRTEPMNFVNHPTIQAALEEFYQDPDVVGLFRYVEGGLRTWFPEHHSDFHDAINSVRTTHPHLKTPCPNTCFAASTVNTGDRVVCGPHRDASNEAAAVCLDYIDGDFDINKGGHLILHEARRIVKLRLGGIMVFPSAVISHENIPIGPGESRFSITGYLAGGLRRYLAAGGKTLTEWMHADPVAATLHAEGGESRWAAGCARFKTPVELVRHWQAKAADPPANPSGPSSQAVVSVV